MSLKDITRGLTDPRNPPRVTYGFDFIIISSLCAVMSGEDSFTGIADYVEVNRSFFAQFFDLPPHLPRHDTYARVFDLIDANEFDLWFVRLTSQIVETLQGSCKDILEHCAIDGKTIRNTTKNGERNLHIIHVWSSSSQLVLQQLKTESKSNEIPAVLELLSTMDLTNRVLTLDALHCQREICQRIENRGGKYIISLKENQKSLYKEVVKHFEAIEHLESVMYVHNDKAHGRIERRSCLVTSDINLLKQREGWPGIYSIAKVTREITKKNKTTTQEHYYISSLEGDPEKILDIIRKHWAVENNLHWVLDVTFNEDKSCIRNENAALNMASARKIAINLQNSVKDEKTSLKSMQRKSWNPHYAIGILIKFFDT